MRQRHMSMEEEQALYLPKYDNRDGDYIKYGDGLLTKNLTNLNYTVDMAMGSANHTSFS